MTPRAQVSTHRSIWRVLLLGLVVSLVLGGCSIERMAVDSLVYSGEEDPDLVAEALPFRLKTFESLLQVSPRRADLPPMASSCKTGRTGWLEDRVSDLFLITS